jgi:predicted oxidoreductase (fatty acid repression mutant protein)
MHQYYLWTALEAEGLGANLQHYNPLPDQKAAELFNIPLEWSLKAQLVFGTPAEGARAGLSEKEQKKPVEERVFFKGL